MLRNQVCEGRVIHRRYEPEHEFAYRVALLCLDVSEPVDSRWLAGVRRRLRPLRFGPAEWLAGTADPLAAINKRLQEHGYPPCRRAFALGQPRSFGWYFNPVCFYFCEGEDGVDFVLAEINNTPWDEKFVYVLDARGQHDELKFCFPKRFHVSPFFPMQLEYRWRFKLKPERIEIAMHLQRDGVECFFAGMYLETQPLSEAALRRAVWRYPLQNLRTLARIYWQAARLYVKRARFFPHPDEPKEVATS